MIYFLTAIGFTPGGSNTVHIYAQTIDRTTKKQTKKQTIRRTTQKNTYLVNTIINIRVTGIS
jgi:hypothetical protein